jgi:hypothetical protein
VANDKGVQLEVGASPNNDSSAVSSTPPVTAPGVARFEGGALGCSVEGVSGDAAAGFTAGAGGIPPSAGSPLWARTVTAGGDI